MISSNLEDLRAGLSRLVDDEIVHALRQIEEISRKAHSIMLDVVAEADMRRIAARNGFGTTPRMLSAMLRSPPPRRAPGPSTRPWSVPAGR